MSIGLSNPVVGREVTERLRGLRAFVVIAAFVLVLTLTLFLVYEAMSSQASFDLATRTRVGRTVYEAVLLIMTLLVLFFVPGLTAGAIAGERERQTLSTLQVTLLRPRSIIAGKILAALAYLGLLLVASLPVLAVAYALGGIRLVDIGSGVLAVAFVALVLAAMVVAISTFAKRVQTATILAYGFVTLLTIAGPLAYGIATIFDARSEGAEARPDETIAPAFLLTPNPLTLVVDVAGGATADAGPLSAMQDGLGEAWYRNDQSWFALFPDTRLGDIAFDDRERPDSRPPAWVLSSLSLTALAVAMSWGAARRLRAPAEVER